MPEKSLEFANSSSKQTKPVTQYYHIYSIKRRNSKHLSVLHDIYKWFILIVVGYVRNVILK